MTQIPVLTYHANNINGNEYQNNDHIALIEDLKLIHQLGFDVISIDQLMAWHGGQVTDDQIKKTVVLTCDDGTWFDFHDVEHSSFGQQISFFNILKNHQQQTGSPVHMSNFVIVSPEARHVLDQTCLVGKNWWQDDWWLTAQRSEIMNIENHSWDHNHGVFDNDNIDDDTFVGIKDLEGCDRQIKQAQRVLKQILEDEYQPQYFAYPYGDYSEYLRFEYLPQFGHQLHLKAAFTTEPKHVTKMSDQWALPRYICNNDWCSTDDLKNILLSTPS